MDANLNNPIYHDTEKARRYLERVRWPHGPLCPHCGSVKDATRLQGQSHRPGTYQCKACEKQFSVTVGTVYESSHIPLHKWLLATHLMTASKKGISAHQLHRMLGITYKSAWFMAHRIREGMRDTSPAPMGGEGKTVEADETFIGRKAGSPPRAGFGHKMAVMSLVERGGAARSFAVANINSGTLVPLMKRTIAKDTSVMTDSAWAYGSLPLHFAKHETVNHSIYEFVRGDAHTNTIEGFFSIFKRGMKGVYQHCSEQHLQRYLTEFDFRYTNRIAVGVDDKKRALLALKGIEGKRLTYRQTDRPTNQDA
jgi:transposase-like protein